MGALVDQLASHRRFSALHVACGQVNLQGVCSLLECRADPNLRDECPGSLVSPGEMLAAGHFRKHRGTPVEYHGFLSPTCAPLSVLDAHPLRSKQQLARSSCGGTEHSWIAALTLRNSSVARRGSWSPGTVRSSSSMCLVSSFLFPSILCCFLVRKLSHSGFPRRDCWDGPLGICGSFFGAGRGAGADLEVNPSEAAHRPVQGCVCTLSSHLRSRGFACFSCVFFLCFARSGVLFVVSAVSFLRVRASCVCFVCSACILSVYACLVPFPDSGS